MTTKIKNNKRLAILGETVKFNTPYGHVNTYEKGREFELKDLYWNGTPENWGYYDEWGLIPLEKITKFVNRWDEVEIVEEDGTIITKTTRHEKDETEEVLEWFAKLATKRLRIKNRHEVATLKAKIKDLKNEIKRVETGETAKELDKLMEALANLDL